MGNGLLSSVFNKESWEKESSSNAQLNTFHIHAHKNEPEPEY